MSPSPSPSTPSPSRKQQRQRQPEAVPSLSLSLPPSPPNSPSAGADYHHDDDDDARNDDKVAHRLRDLFHKRAHLLDHWYCFQLSADEFARLHKRLLAPQPPPTSTDGEHEHEHEQDDFREWCSGKLRWNWDPEFGQLTLRMPAGIVHEEFIAAIRTRVLKALAQVAASLEHAGDSEAAAQIRMIREGANRPITFNPCVQGEDDGETRETPTPSEETETQSFESSAPSSKDSSPPHERTPDLVFCHAGQGHYPPAVMEVAYSQAAGSLQPLAEEYILASDAFIRTVVAFKLAYHHRSGSHVGRKRPTTSGGNPSSAKARVGSRDLCCVSLWRACIRNGIGDTRCDVDGEPFCDENGQALPGNLDLRVRDFIPVPVIEGPSPSPLTSQQLNLAVRIPFADLASMLRHAKLEEEKSRRPQPKYAFAGQTGTRKRPRTSPQAEWQDDVALKRRYVEATASSSSTVDQGNRVRRTRSQSKKLEAAATRE